MRTTLNIEDSLIQQVKRRAVSLNVTVSEFVSRALREALLRPEAEKRGTPFQMITFGTPTEKVHHEPADFSASISNEEERTFKTNHVDA